MIEKANELLSEYRQVRRLFQTQPRNAAVDELCADVAVLKALLSIKSTHRALHMDEITARTIHAVAQAEEIILTAQRLTAASQESGFSNRIPLVSHSLLDFPPSRT